MNSAFFIESIPERGALSRERWREQSIKRLNIWTKNTEFYHEIKLAIGIILHDSQQGPWLYEKIRARVLHDCYMAHSLQTPNNLLPITRPLIITLLPIKELSSAQFKAARNKIQGELSNTLYFNGSRLSREFAGKQDTLVLEKCGSQVKISEISYSGPPMSCFSIQKDTITEGSSYLIGQTILEMTAFTETLIEINVFRYPN